MRALISLISMIGSVISAVRYELARLRGIRSTRGAVLSALAGSALLTLPAARHMVGLMHPFPPLPSLPHPDRGNPDRAYLDHVYPKHVYPDHAYASRGYPGHSQLSHVIALASQHTPMHAGGAWVVAGGVVGMVLPGAAAVWGAAWFGATSIGYEYRYRGGMLTFTLAPRRESVLIAKAVVAAGFGALLCLGTTAIAYGTAVLGFRAAGTPVALPVPLLVPGPRAVAVAALGGALGVFGGVVLRARLVATVSAVLGCVLVGAFLPRSSSLAMPYLGKAARYIVRLVPGVTYTAALDLLLVLPLTVLVLSGLVAVRRRRVV